MTSMVRNILGKNGIRESYLHIPNNLDCVTKKGHCGVYEEQRPRLAELSSD